MSKLELFKSVDRGNIRTRETTRGRRYVGEFYADKRVHRKTFDTEEEAGDWVASQWKLIGKHGTESLDIDGDQRRDAAEALKILKASGLRPSLVEAAEFYAAHVTGITHKLLESAFTEYYAAQESDGAGARHLGDIRSILGNKFLVHFDGFEAHELGKNDVQEWVTGLGLAKATRKNHLAHAHAFLNYCKDMNWTTINAASGVKYQTGGRKRSDSTMPEHMKASDVERLLRALLKGTSTLQRRRSTAFGLAVAFFTGIRISRLSKLTWSEIDFENETIRLVGTKTGAGDWRDVPIEPNLMTWLVEFRKAEGRVIPSERTLGRNRKAFCKVLKIRWVKNAYRHNYATYHLAKYKDEGRTMTNLGHSDFQIFRKHYRGRVRDLAEVEKYWAIVPKGLSSSGATLSAKASA